MNALEIKNLRKEYKDFTLNNLNLTLPGGCIMGLVGENGAGKSTTLKLILNLIEKDSGTVTILGNESPKNPCLIKEDLGVVLDNVGIPECLNTAQLEKVMSGVFRNWNSETYKSLLKRLSIPEKKKFKDFSKGNKMKLGIAVALSHEPKLLILDEATSGLDPVVRDDITDILNDFTRDENHSVLISSHIVSDLEKLCDYIAFLHNGNLLLCEEKDLLIGQYSIVHCKEEGLKAIPESSVLHKKITPYSAEALVKRKDIPEGMLQNPVSIEELFIYMVKEEK